MFKSYRKYILLSLALLVLVAVLVLSLIPAPQSGDGGANPCTDSPLYLYAVKSSGQVETYSPLHGKIRAFGLFDGQDSIGLNAVLDQIRGEQPPRPAPDPAALRGDVRFPVCRSFHFHVLASARCAGERRLPSTD